MDLRGKAVFYSALYWESDSVFRQRLLDRIGNNPFFKQQSRKKVNNII